MSDHFIRPKSTVLPASALVPPQNLLRPAPNRFTHELRREQPYYYEVPRHGATPDGVFDAGTPVVLLRHDGTAMCHVADGRGLYVLTAFDGLMPIA